VFHSCSTPRNGIRIRLFGAIRIITVTICDYRDSLLAWNLPVVRAAIMPVIFLRSSLDILLLVFLAAAFLAIRTYQRRGRLPYPPGPRPLPLVGNLFDIPKEFSWLSYAQLSKKHGMVYFGSRSNSDRKKWQATSYLSASLVKS
jgi:hypothetical protein